MRTRKAVYCTSALVGAVLLSMLVSGTPSPILAGARPAAATVKLVGAGSTFDAPFFSRAFAAYSKLYPVSIAYHAIGSSGGIQQFSANKVDFGASDVPMNKAELAQAVLAGGDMVQLPVALGGIAIAYNLPSVSSMLKLDAPTLTHIFLGTITRWNDPAIARLNPAINVPNIPIIPVHRADGSGTTYIFSDYLSTASAEWFYKEGRGKVAHWPVGLAGTGNAGVGAAIKQHPGAIGYVELSYALAENLPYMALRNFSGAFVLPTQASIAAAAAQYPDIYAQHFSIVDAPGVHSYPIAGYSWALLRRHPTTHAADLVHLFRWLTTAGQQYAAQLHYVPLPAGVQQLASTVLSNIT